MNLDLKEFVAGLKAVGLTCAKKPYMAALGWVSLTPRSNVLWLRTTTLDVQTDFGVNCDAPDIGNFAVEHAALLDVAGKLKGPDVSLKVQDGKLIVSSGTRSFTLPLRDVDSMPVSMGGDQEFSSLLQAIDQTLSVALARVTYSMSKDTARENLLGVNLRMAAGKAVVEASDGHRLAIAPLDAALFTSDDFCVNLPPDLVKAIVKLKPKEDIRLTRSADGKLVKLWGDMIVWTVRMLPDFPDIPKMLSYWKAPTTTFSVLAEALREAVSAALSVATEYTMDWGKARFLALAHADGQAGVYAVKHEDETTFFETVSAPSINGSIWARNKLNGLFLADALKGLIGEVTLGMAGTEVTPEPLQITEADGTFHVIMTARA